MPFESKFGPKITSFPQTEACLYMSEPELALIIFFYFTYQHVITPYLFTNINNMSGGIYCSLRHFTDLFQRVIAIPCHHKGIHPTICHFLNFLRPIHCCIFWLMPVMNISANILSKLHFDFQGQIFVVFFAFCKSPSSGKIFRNKNTCTVLKN